MVIEKQDDEEWLLVKWQVVDDDSVWCRKKVLNKI